MDILIGELVFSVLRAPLGVVDSQYSNAIDGPCSLLLLLIKITRQR